MNSALINVNITNTEATTVDINEHYENFKKYKFTKKHSNDRIGSYIERSKVGTVLSYINNNHNKATTKITVYFINQKCINEGDISEDGQFKASGGISPTGTGIAYLVLDPDLHKDHAENHKDIDAEYSVDREEYDLLRNNCGTFAMDVIKADKEIKAPWFMINTSPNEIVEEFIEEGHQKIEYNAKTHTTKVG